jgi:hypothetical protein
MGSAQCLSSFVADKNVGDEVDGTESGAARGSMRMIMTFDIIFSQLLPIVFLRING